MRFKLHEGISIDMVIALFASHFSNLRERTAMSGTKVPQEESLISATEYKERSKEALSRIARSMSNNIAAQAIALACSLALLLGKISLGYFAIDRSTPSKNNSFPSFAFSRAIQDALSHFWLSSLLSSFSCGRGPTAFFLRQLKNAGAAI